MPRVFVFSIHLSRRRLLWLAIVLLVVAALFAVAKRGAPPGFPGAFREWGAAVFPIGGAPPPVTVPVLALDEAAPEYVLYAPDGSEWTRDSWEGPYVLVFWASWCAECAPFVAVASRVHAALGGASGTFDGSKPNPAVGLAAVSVADSPGQAADFAARHRFTAPVLHDPAGDAASALGIGLLPAAVLVDEDGFVRDRLFGNVSEPLYTARLQAILPSPEDSDP